jgi:hypothetical protein
MLFLIDLAGQLLSWQLLQQLLQIAWMSGLYSGEVSKEKKHNQTEKRKIPWVAFVYDEGFSFKS